MSTLSFMPEWIDMLLNGDKQQTTRKQTNRIKVGDVVNVYNQQRRRIIDKPLRQLTPIGYDMMCQREYPNMSGPESYHAHFLGKVRITEVYDIHPIEMSEEALKSWAIPDGFKSFHPMFQFPEQLCPPSPGANMWFIEHYGEDWMDAIWTVNRWNGWVERYFEPVTCDLVQESDFTRYPERSDEDENRLWGHHIGGEQLPPKQEV